MASKEQQHAADKAYREGLARQQAAKAARRAANLWYLEEKKKSLEERHAQEKADEKSGAVYRRITTPPSRF
jgi:hypothetical protein